MLDTNVLIVANNRGAKLADTCVDACVDCIDRLVKGKDVLHLDTSGDILAEYGNHMGFGTPQGVGDQFFVYAMTFQGTPAFCSLVKINPDPETEYAEFPDDPALTTFDRSDRKFVAVAIASNVKPTIYNAADSDWAHHAAALSKHVTVEELCP